ncbi:DUF6090 family protein [Leeuwenhoekiella nanhaiensis]|uniref:Uncharacterized protein n=1 Tax=Leeuwenhoekiella nanhaiensis TaxID=1655491 RepID=A0A2G1VNW5_9FLAO|nr:DUF6090 family protein [Leeuwenhoekiella nanhaiensis]PHQ28452.1 hypothetical protein CJ305_15175 [Leeuwenhoekiella nanhaiensis]
MIKFFRNIRHKLLDEGKTGKYLKYAVGEIILVVIGILIALQINNWNEDRKEQAEAIALLSQLHAEFESNRKQLEEKMIIRNNMIAASFKLLNYIDHPEKRHLDSVNSHLVQTLLVPTFDPVVNDIISSGRIQLLRNNRLKELLTLWTSEIIQVTEEEVAWGNYKLNSYSPFLTKVISTRSILNQYWQENAMETFYLDKGTTVKFNIKNSRAPTDFANLFESPEFENHLAVCATDAKIANIQSLSLKNRINEILEIITQELKEKQ